MEKFEKKNLPRLGKQYLKIKLNQLNSAIEGGSFIERLFRKFFKQIYEKRAQKTALEKFSELNKIAQQLKNKET